MRIIAVSHTAELAETNSTAVQRFIRDNTEVLGYALANDNRGHWHTTNGCEYLAVGAGAAVRGFRADYIIIDDPIRRRQEAESETQREHLWDYYQSDLMSRLKPDGAVILIATPFHEDDLMGRLRRLQPYWNVLRMPAIAEADDPLGRAEGEPLWSDDGYNYGAGLLREQADAEREGRTRDWWSQYQCAPRPPEGAMFKPQQMPILDLLPPILEQVRAWDLASSAGKGDWTVGLKLAHVVGQNYTDMFIVTDLRRIRGAPEEVRKLVKDTAEADGYGVKIWLPRDPAQAGADQAESYIRMLIGYAVEAERMSGDKVTRADAAASQANIGRIGMVRAPWNAAFADELAAFPRGVHDDQVDALSLAFSKLAVTGLDIWLRM
jgi:predicted phage terminase large subunit-like protein